MALTRAELLQIKESLQELSPNAEDFALGPSYELAKQRKADALKLIDQELKALPGGTKLKL